MQQALESAMADLCLGAPVTDDEDAIRDWLRRHEVDEDDVQYLTQTGLERLGVYRRLVRDNLYGALEVSIPRTMARLGDEFDHWFARFLVERGPRTHYLRDVVDEFLEFVEPHWLEADSVPPCLYELACHEALRIQIGAMQSRPVEAVPPALDLDRGVRFIEAARVVRYGHAVHELRDDETDRRPPERRPVALLVYRSPDHLVRFLELSPMAAAILDGLMGRGLTLREAMVEAASETGHSLNDATIGGAARLLADLAERGALLGAARTE